MTFMSNVEINWISRQARPGLKLHKFHFITFVVFNLSKKNQQLIFEHISYLVYHAGHNQGFGIESIAMVTNLDARKRELEVRQKCV